MRWSSIPQVNRKRKAKRKAEGLVYGWYHREVKRRQCIGWGHPHHACEVMGPRRNIEGHHVTSVGAGGKDRGNEVPVCPKLHDQVEGKVWGWSRSRVEKMLGVGLREIAREIEDDICGMEF